MSSVPIVDFSDNKSIKSWLENIHEKYTVELKNSTSNLSNDFWPTYSSFANTCGGWIALGVKEDPIKNEILGVKNASHIITNLWNLLSNPQKVSFRCVENDDVHTFSLEGNDIILVYVHEAPEYMKPVYVNGNRENTYIRTGDGDRKATIEELGAFLRNAHPGHDNLAAEKFTLQDLDEDSVLSFKERVNKRYPRQKYIEMTNEAFLSEIGAAYHDRETGAWLLRRGTLLFLGKVNAIKELFPHYHIDYFNRRGGNSRWIDRVSDDEPSAYEMNLYNFFSIVYEKMRTMLQEAFVLDNAQLRIPVADFDETLRECIVNCLAHADYVQGYPSIKIEAFDGWFRFLNPGKMLVSTEQFKAGGDSRPRNETIMKLFRLLGASERQGFGGPLIFKSALENKYRSPEIETSIESTELKVWNIDLVDSYPDLTNVEKDVLRIVMKSTESLSIKKISELSNQNDYQTRKAIAALEEANIIEKLGNGPSTRYSLALGSGEFITRLQMIVDNFRKTIRKR